MGEQTNPGDSISYVIPKITSPVGGYNPGSVFDYMGLPTVGQVGGANTITHSCLPLRAYALIWNEWFRDENLQNSISFSVLDGPDLPANYTLLKRGKRHDYFTSALPWPQKGGTSVSLPLGTSAPVKSDGTAFNLTGSNWTNQGVGTSATGQLQVAGLPANGSGAGFGTVTGLYADLSAATAATINQLRQSFAIQRLLERDARGGTRYTEILRAHFGVYPPDFRLQRPEYLGGGSSRITVTPIAQTSGTNASGTTTPLVNLAALATGVARHGFTQSFTEHGYIIGLACVRADLNYQQGLRKHWSRDTRYDFYFPAFAHLGEQAILNKEIYEDGSANDNNVFGYQERWSEYRYFPSMITGLFRSTTAGTLDGWHLAERFSSLPGLNSTFIQQNTPMSRVLAVGAGANGKQFIFDSFYMIGGSPILNIQINGKNIPNNDDIPSALGEITSASEILLNPKTLTKEEIRFRVKTSVQAREQILTVDNLGDWDATGSDIRIETTKVMSTWYITAIYSTHSVPVYTYAVSVSLAQTAHESAGTANDHAEPLKNAIALS